MNKIFFIGIGLIFLLFSFGLGFSLGKEQAEENLKETQEKLNMLMPGLTGSPPSSAPPTVLSGGIIGNTLVGEIVTFDANARTLALLLPLPAVAETATDADVERVIRLSGDVKIYRLEKKDEETILKDLMEHQKRIQESDPESSRPGAIVNTLPPTAFRQIETDFSALIEGQTVTVTGEQKEDGIFEATMVEISDTMTLPPTGPVTP